MSTRFTIQTRKLLGLLDDLITTAGNQVDEPTFNGIHISSARGAWGEEPGDVDLLVGISANGEVVGNTWVPGIGSIDAGFWALINVKNIKYVFNPLAKRHDKENGIDDPHMVNIIVKDGFVTIFEETSDEPTELQFPVEDNDFPLSGMVKWINGESANTPKDEDGNDAEDGALTVWTPALGLFLGVARRRKEFLRLYSPDHSAKIHTAQIGESWRGAIKPNVPKNGTIDVDKPDSDFFL